MSQHQYLTRFWDEGAEPFEYPISRCKLCGEECHDLTLRNTNQGLVCDWCLASPDNAYLNITKLSEK